MVNADSMQLYRGMDIGTAKLSVAERRGVPHHLLDIWPVTRTATLAEYQTRALDAVAEISGRGRVPILVGGSGMYVHAVVDRWDIPGTDPQVRERLEAELAGARPESLHERLAELDPIAAAAILPTNGRRIVRALEVVEMRGSFSATLPTVRPEPRACSSSGCGSSVTRSTSGSTAASRACGTPGFVDEVRALERAGSARGPHGVPRARLRPGARLPRGGVQRG